MPQAHRATKLLADWQSHFCETHISPWGIMYFSTVTLCLYLYFLCLIRSVFAKTGILSLTFHWVIFSNNIQSEAYEAIALTVLSLTSEVITISFSHSLSSHYRSPNLHSLQRDILLQNYPGRKKFCGVSFLLAAAPPPETCYSQTSARSGLSCYHRYPTVCRGDPFIFSVFTCPE